MQRKLCSQLENFNESLQNGTTRAGGGMQVVKEEGTGVGN